MPTINDFLLNLPLPLVDHWGYLILFFSALLETTPILGTFIPGHAVVFFSGFLAYLGVFRLDAAILVAFFGAVAGDTLSYFIGYRYGQDFILRYGKYFFLNQARYEKTKRLIEEHAGKTLIIGRFVSFARAFTAFIAGVTKIRFSRFFFFACLGGLAWAGSSVLIGYIFGHGFAAASKYFGRFIILAVVIIAVLIFSYHLLNKKIQAFAKFHVFYLFLNGISIYLFSKMAEDYYDKEIIYRLDLWLDGKITLLWQPFFNQLLLAVSWIFSPENLLAIAIVSAAYFGYRRKWLSAGLIFFGLGGGVALGALTKWLVHRPRPLGGLIEETGWSFPSQHSLAAMIFFSLVIFLFWEKIHRRWQKHLFVAGGIFLIISIGFSRLFLKVHWFSDVIAGWSLGLFWLTFLILAARTITQLTKNYPGWWKLKK